MTAGWHARAQSSGLHPHTELEWQRPRHQARSSPPRTCVHGCGCTAVDAGRALTLAPAAGGHGVDMLALNGLAGADAAVGVMAGRGQAASAADHACNGGQEWCVQGMLGGSGARELRMFAHARYCPAARPSSPIPQVCPTPHTSCPLTDLRKVDWHGALQHRAGRKLGRTRQPASEAAACVQGPTFARCHLFHLLADGATPARQNVSMKCGIARQSGL